MADITLTIDGAPVTVPAGTTILKAAEKLGRQVPTICYHDIARRTVSAAFAWSKSKA